LAVFNTDKREERKKIDNSSVLNTVLHTQRIVKSFSVKPSDFNTLVAFLEISQREDSDFSTTVVRAMQEYVQHHSIPNPQARLDRILDIELPHKPRWQCCVPECKAKATYVLFLKDYEGKTESFQVCSQHQKWKHSRYKFLSAYRELKSE